MISQNQIGPEDTRQIITNFFAPGKFNQLSRIPGIEITCHPIGLFAFNAALIKLVAGALENEEAMAELLNIGAEFLADREGIRRQQPVFFREENLLGEGTADDPQS